jgi:biotin synthase
MGESNEDRESLLDSIVSLNPESTPLNFYITNPALPLKGRNINTEEALSIIKKARKLLGDDRLLMVAGGREQMFSGREREMFDAGVNSIVIGNYLTTTGDSPLKDIIMLEELEYDIATTCDG